MSTLDVMAQVRSIDPITPAEIDAWSPAFELSDLLDGELSGRRRIRSRRAAAALVGGGLVVGVATSAAALGVLGSTAPDPVKQHLAALDAGMPADLRYHADVEHATAVASSATAALYEARLTGGGYCLEVVTESVRPRGATCLTETEAETRPLDVIAPIPDGDSSTLVFGGRVNDARIVQLAVLYADGSTAPIVFGVDRAWLFEVPAGRQATALSDGVAIVASDADGAQVVAIDVPPLHDDDPTGGKGEAMQPVFVSTISDGADLTLVLGIEGRINVPAAALELRYPDGTTAPVAVHSDGSYHFDIPAERQADFATQAGSLVATDASGATVGTARVASVAYWRSAGS